MSTNLEKAAAGIDQESLPPQAASANQPQEPKPKGASRSRRRKAPVRKAGEGIHDPALYAEMAVPFATRDEANDALSVFFADLRALRIKHRIADVVAVACVNVTRVGPIITWAQNGDAAKGSFMLAWGLGASERSDKELLDTVRNKGAVPR